MLGAGAKSWTENESWESFGQMFSEVRKRGLQLINLALKSTTRSISVAIFLKLSWDALVSCVFSFLATLPCVKTKAVFVATAFLFWTYYFLTSEFGSRSSLIVHLFCCSSDFVKDSIEAFDSLFITSTVRKRTVCSCPKQFPLNWWAFAVRSNTIIILDIILH